MAQPNASDNGARSDVCQLLRLAGGGERMLVPIGAVREILEVGRSTPLPRAPDFVLGVMNLRGSVVPVIDVSARFGQGRAPLGKRSAIVVVDVQSTEDEQRMVAGMLVDAVYEVLDVDAASIESVPALGVAVPHEFLSGMVNVRGNYEPLLSLNQLLSPTVLAALISAGAR